MTFKNSFDQDLANINIFLNTQVLIEKDPKIKCKLTVKILLEAQEMRVGLRKNHNVESLPFREIMWAFIRGYKCKKSH